MPATGRIQDDCRGRDECCGDRKDQFACRARTVKSRVIIGEAVDPIYVAQQLVIRRCELVGRASVGGGEWIAGVWVKSVLRAHAFPVTPNNLRRNWYSNRIFR